MDPKCKRCIATFGAAILFVYACPNPHNDECPYKASHEHAHSEMYPGPPDENSTMTIASTAAAIDRRYVFYIEPDPDREGEKKYYVNQTASPTT